MSATTRSRIVTPTATFVSSESATLASRRHHPGPSHRLHLLLAEVFGERFHLRSLQMRRRRARTYAVNNAQKQTPSDFKKQWPADVKEFSGRVVKNPDGTYSPTDPQKSDSATAAKPDPLGPGYEGLPSTTLTVRSCTTPIMKTSLQPIGRLPKVKMSTPFSERQAVQ